MLLTRYTALCSARATTHSIFNGCSGNQIITASLRQIEQASHDEAMRSITLKFRTTVVAEYNATLNLAV